MFRDYIRIKYFWLGCKLFLHCFFLSVSYPQCVLQLMATLNAHHHQHSSTHLWIFYPICKLLSVSYSYCHIEFSFFHKFCSFHTEELGYRLLFSLGGGAHRQYGNLRILKQNYDPLLITLACMRTNNLRFILLLDYIEPCIT